MTSTVSGITSSSRRISFTRRLPGNSTSRRGLRSTTFMSIVASPPWRLRPRRRAPLRLRESGRGLDLAELSQMHALVRGLQLPPLGEVEITEAEVIERQPARIDGGQLLDGLAAPLARGLEGGDQLTDRLALPWPDHGRRLHRTGRHRRQRREGRQVGGEGPEGARGLPRHFGG